MEPNYNHNNAPLPLRQVVYMTNFNTYQPKSTICQHCNGSIIQKYDRVYCIQCSREPVRKHPTTISDAEYIQHKKGEASIQARIRNAHKKRIRGY
jgi:hypothetical protein